jgi:acyl-CoA thioester hydrolase
MGIVHHTNHLVWFEIGRTELLRDLGLSYAALEEREVFMPVVEAGARYRRPVRYDEEVDVLTRVEELTGVTVRFSYQLLRQPGDELVATGFTLHAATDGKGSARRLPAELRSRLATYVERPEPGP